jgi:hypothetical protein
MVINNIIAFRVVEKVCVFIINEKIYAKNVVEKVYVNMEDKSILVKSVKVLLFVHMIELKQIAFYVVEQLCVNTVKRK